MGDREIMKILKQAIKKYFPFLIFIARKFETLLHFQSIKERNEKIIIWKIFGKKIERNSWNNKESSSYETYRKLILWSWEETKLNAPEYFERLNFTVSKSRGKILEIGCGIGTMTKWLSKSDKVKEIIAIDTSSEAIEELERYNLTKVTALQMKAENIYFDDTKKFDTVLICEVIEHLYPDEERKMLNTLMPYINSETIYIISTPIGFMDDPHHVRGFSKKQFINHLKKYYGDPLEVDYSSRYSQSAFGYFNVKDKME